jgi:predicted NUDIX family phosphoesterase
MTSEFLDVAERTLMTAQRSMSPKEIVHYAMEQRWFSDKRAGRTPIQTMKSKLSVSIRKDGDRSTFVRTAPGRFSLRHLVSADSVYEAAPHRPPPARELVLACATAEVKDLLPQGIQRDVRKLLSRLQRPELGRVLMRLRAEQTDDHKQLLTYILVRRGNSVLAYKRGVYNRVEDMLKGAQCVGFGGHICPDDRDLLSPDVLGIFGCARRELREELLLPEPDLRRLDAGIGLSILGILNDDSSDVGRRHLAIVLQYEVSDDVAWDRPRRGEKSITQLRWLTVDAAVRCWEFEYWSQMCLREFLPDLIQSAPAFVIRRTRPIQPPHLLCLVGEMASGKTEASHVLVTEFGYVEVNSGQVVADLIGMPPIPLTPRETFQPAAYEFISRPDGPDRLALEILHRARGAEQRLLVDGIRQRKTLLALRGHALPGERVGVLFVHTTADVAFALYRHREAQIPFDAFIRLRSAPVEQEAASLIDLSDGVLYNWTGRRNYRQTVRALMRDLGTTRQRPSAATTARVSP